MSDLVAALRDGLAARADAARAPGMQAYMKSTMPYRGVTTPEQRRLVRDVLAEGLAGLDNVLITEPLGYATFAKLLARSYFVVTDSGGVQEEAPSLGKPVLVLRETTERIEGVHAGTLRVIGTDPDRIHHEGLQLIEDPVAYAEMAHAPNPYGDGKAARRVQAKLGRASVNAIEVVQGLKPGDKVIISDVSQWDGQERLRIK